MNETQKKEFKRLIQTWEKRKGKFTPEVREFWKATFLMMDIKGDCKKPITIMETRKTYLVPIVDVMLDGLKGGDLEGKYPEKK